MKRITYSRFQQNLKRSLDQVIKGCDPLIVTMSNQQEVVVLSKSEYQSLNETLHLLGSLKNAERLFRGIEEYEKMISMNTIT